ncbi:uncharacterized protein LOC129942548 [Eupeodes corollae]|uniref:uncharacterized protein LOC129942548 n=1 Tax=Eupeodes corollae TaxID=290404 RepID=UPI002492FB34|nr:uncharacterized protein LOC129942548 [Eupeodes corollae]XP_055907516.1 uncharacterized protein LOC129942548 [Eupeodes corollae]
MQHLLPHKQPILSLVVFLIVIAAPPSTWAQENAQLQIPPSLVECYNTSYYMNRDNRLPSTINTLIDLIRKVENSPDFNMDARQLSVALLHRFRQDGIQRATGVQAGIPGVLPYSPTGFQFPKFRILLTRLIPGNANTFPNASLSQQERCSMHFMLSSSYNLRVRGDENMVCNRLSQYRSNRFSRSVNDKPYKSNFLGDVEFIETHKNSKKEDKVKTNPYMDFDYWNDGGDVNYGNDNSVSQCPVENGVIWTPWGTVTAGNLIAGIAAGLQPQTIQLKTLLALSRRPGQFGGRQSTLTVDNRWAATLAGDLAEVALVQVPMSPSSSASVGAGGAWNDTVMAKWYFMSRRDNLEMTDAEIRGDLDGLIIAMNIANWKNQASGIKLSQLLSMYYSLGGVLDSGIKACNRQQQFNTVAPVSDMASQTAAFAQVLDAEMQLRVTLQQPAIQQFSQSAAGELGNYVPQYLNDISCEASNVQTGDVSEKITTMTDIFVYIDTSWEYNAITDYVSYVLERINVAPYASSVTLLSAGDGRIIANTTYHMSDVYQQWNVSTQSNYSPGFNLPLILKSVQNLTQTLMIGQQQNNTVGGRSMIALLVPNMATVNDGDSNYVQIQLQYIYEQIPDLKFLYFTGGSAIRFNSFVVDPSKDIFQISLGQNNYASQGRPVVQRIKELQRRIINPRCGAYWYSSTWGQDQMYQYIRPNFINFYRLMPNYFYIAGGSRQVSVNGASGTTLTVCTSRYNPRPMQNATTSTSNGQSDVTCQQLTNTGNSMTYDLSNACNGYFSIHSCPPLYISVQATSTYSSQSSCMDSACQYPDEVRYQVTVQNLGCYSGVGKLLASLTVIMMAAILRHIVV